MSSLRRARREDCAALAAASERSVIARAPLSEAELLEQLFDVARDHGGQTAVVAGAHDEPLAAMAWVNAVDAGGAGAAGAEFYLSPLIAEDVDHAAALLTRGRAAAEAVGAAWIRVSAGAGEPAQRALAAHGYEVAFDFLELALPIDPALAPSIDADLPAGWRAAPLTTADRAQLLELNNLAFDGVPNSPPLTLEELDEILASPRLLPAASHVLLDPEGAHAAFLLCLVAGARADVAVIEAVAVSDRFRRRGLGVIAVRLALRALRGTGLTELRALIASQNAASLALHHSLGFREKYRRQVWQLTLR